jgi:acyl carrier protein
MSNIRQRLAQCFFLAFPGLGESEVYSAAVESVAAWDSTASIVLANVIEEEFNIPIDYEVLPDLTSFDLILNYLTSRSNGPESRGHR